MYSGAIPTVRNPRLGTSEMENPSQAMAVESQRVAVESERVHVESQAPE
jgi:hypothetical protein